MWSEGGTAETICTVACDVGVARTTLLDRHGRKEAPVAEDHDMVLGATTKVVWKTSSDEVTAYEVVRHDRNRPL